MSLGPQSGVSVHPYTWVSDPPTGSRVTNDEEADQLVATRRYAVVLGVVVDKVGRVLYGEIVDPQCRGSYRFVGLDGIPVAVRGWLGETLGDQSRDES
jgi:hypothetical protein